MNIFVLNANPIKGREDLGEARISPLITRALAASLWDEPEEFLALVDKAEEYLAANGDLLNYVTAEEHLLHLIGEGLVESRRGLYLLTPKGRRWAKENIDVGVEAGECDREPLPAVPRATMIFWANPACLENRAWGGRG